MDNSKENELSTPDVLKEIMKSLKESNKNAVMLRDVLEHQTEIRNSVTVDPITGATTKKATQQKAQKNFSPTINPIAKQSTQQTIQEINKTPYEHDDFASHFRNPQVEAIETAPNKHLEGFGKLLDKFADKFGGSVDDLGHSTDRLKDVKFGDDEARPQKKFGGLLGKLIDKGVTTFGGMSPTEMRREEWGDVSEKLNQTEQADAVFSRATGDVDGRNVVQAHEQRQLDALQKRLDAGEIDTGDLTHEEFMGKAKKDMIDTNNLNAIRTRKPEFDLGYQDELKENLGINKTDGEEAVAKQLAASKAELDKMMTQINLVEAQAKLDGYQNGTLDPTQPNNEPTKDILDQAIEYINKNSEYNKQNDLQSITPAEKPWEERGKKFMGDKLNIKEIKVGAINSKIINTKKLNQEKQDSPLNPLVAGIAGGATANALGIGANKNLQLDNVTIKTLTITSLIIPDQTKEEGDGEGSSGGGGIADTIADVADVSRTRGGKLGKVGSFLGKAGRFASKAALPLAAAMAVGDGVSGYNSANENLGIEGREATFGEKMSSAAGSVASGITMGLVDPKTASKGVAGLFGAGPDAQPNKDSSTTTSFNAEKSETPELTKADKIQSAPDQKQAELSSARAENEGLKQEEKDATAATAQNNVVVNSPTNISAGGKSPPPQNGAVRPTHNAYERFVNRTFSAF